MWYIFLLFALCAGDTSSKYRIKGGYEIDISEVPSVVYLGIENDKYYFECGGTILDKTHILTAGHCIVENMRKVTVRMGSNYTSIGGVEMTAVSYIKHAQYDDIRLFNDIAIVKLGSDIEFGGNIQPAALPQDEDAIAVGKEVTVPGWGATGKPVVGLRHLMAIKIPRIYGAQCTDLKFCAGEEGVPKEMGAGDSGGPALVGQTVYGISSSAKSYVSRFTNVFVFVSWINNVFNGTYPLQPL